MEILWSTTIDPEDLEEWIKTKYGNKDEFTKVYKEKCKEYEKEYQLDINNVEEFVKNLNFIMDLGRKHFFKEFLCNMVDDSVVEVKEISFKKEYNAYLVTYSKE